MVQLTTLIGQVEILGRGAIAKMLLAPVVRIYGEWKEKRGKRTKVSKKKKFFFRIIEAIR